MPRSQAVRATERIAAQSPGASPPLVSTASRAILIIYRLPSPSQTRTPLPLSRIMGEPRHTELRCDALGRWGGWTAPQPTSSAVGGRVWGAWLCATVRRGARLLFHAGCGRCLGGGGWRRDDGRRPL